MVNIAQKINEIIKINIEMASVTDVKNVDLLRPNRAIRATKNLNKL